MTESILIQTRRMDGGTDRQTDDRTSTLINSRTCMWYGLQAQTQFTVMLSLV